MTLGRFVACIRELALIMKTNKITLIVAFLVSFSNIVFGQNDSTQVKILAEEDNLGVRVIRLSSCLKQKSSYYVVSNSDSLLVKYWAADCFTYSRLDNKDSARVDSRQLNGTGKPELLLEYEYSFGSRYGRELIIIDIDAMTIMCRIDIESFIPAADEPPAPPVLIKNKIVFSDMGEIRVQNYFEPSIYSDYKLVDGKYVLQKK